MNGPRSVIPARPVARGAGLFCLGLVVGLWGAARPARADFRIESQTPHQAWSGWWWPVLTTSNEPHLYDTTGKFQPLNRYGLWTGDMGPLHWEQNYEMTSDPQATWFGHCNGWAAAALAEVEPVRTVKSRNGVVFNVGDSKGLLTASHQFDPADYFKGARHDQGADSTTDLQALDFHRTLLYYLRDRNEGVIFNLSNIAEVWSYPLDHMVLTGTADATATGVTHITATLSFPNDNLDAADFVGVNRINRIYTYWVKGDPQSTTGATSAGWEGASASDHPQFVWHSAYARAYNPGTQQTNTLSLTLVRQIATTAATTGGTDIPIIDPAPTTTGGNPPTTNPPTTPTTTPPPTTTTTNPPTGTLTRYVVPPTTGTTNTGTSTPPPTSTPTTTTGGLANMPPPAGISPQEWAWVLAYIAAHNGSH